jgi:hypothetical protein
MELLTKKNIITFTSVIFLGAMLVTASIIGWREYKKYAYQELFRRSYELGKTQQSLQSNLLSALKNKNKQDVRAMYCLGFGRAELREQEADKRFEEFWLQVSQSDMSESLVEISESPNDKTGAQLLVKNIKTNNQNQSQEFSVHSYTYWDKPYKCFGRG